MRLLLVGDNPDEYGCLLLALHEAGFATEMTMSARDGISMAAAAEYDAVVWYRSITSGVGFVECLRQKKDTPLMVLTSGATAKARADALDAGADDCLCQTVETIELLARLRAIIRRRFGFSRATLTFGHLVLHTDLRVATQHGKEVELTKREYDILEYIALRRSRVVSREMLHARLFGLDGRTSNVVDVHIFSLRRKLGQTVIGTRRGQGYFLSG